MGRDSALVPRIVDRGHRQDENLRIGHKGPGERPIFSHQLRWKKLASCRVTVPNISVADMRQKKLFQLGRV